MGLLAVAIIKLVEDYSVTALRKDVRDSLMLAGEQSVLLNLFHAGDADAVPCIQCGDDIYHSPEQKCQTCFGTMFEGGVRYAMKVWALFTDHQYTEKLDEKGVVRADHRSVQMEAFPRVGEHDVIVRVPEWSGDVPLRVEGYYILQQVDQRSLRTGPRAGQYSFDVVGQKANVGELPPHFQGITTFPILGKTFQESVQLSRGTTTTPPQAVIQPDVKVIYFPFHDAPGGPQPGAEPPEGFLFTQLIPAATWTIVHPFSHDPDVNIIVGGEEVETDIDYPGPNLVVLTFGQPVAGTARLT